MSANVFKGGGTSSPSTNILEKESEILQCISVLKQIKNKNNAFINFKW